MVTVLSGVLSTVISPDKTVDNTMDIMVSGSTFLYWGHRNAAWVIKVLLELFVQPQVVQGGCADPLVNLSIFVGGSMVPTAVTNF